jgi:hypothetical protein
MKFTRKLFYQNYLVKCYGLQRILQIDEVNCFVTRRIIVKFRNQFG